MSKSRKIAPSNEGQVVLETLQKVVKQTLEKKKRLGHYAVVWQNGKPVITGDDAPGQQQQH